MTEKEAYIAELQEYFWDEYREYIQSTPMTAYERRLLRKWVSEGHSVYDDPGSKYLGYSCYPMSFLSVYRMDRDLDLELRGIHGDKRIERLKEILGWTDPTPEELAMEEAKRNTPKLIEDLVRHLERDYFHLRQFVWNKGFAEEAKQYVEEHKNEEIPFEW